MIRDDTVEGFLDSVASRAPTPGGGSVAAIAAATGAALVAMVARLTEGREGFESVEARMGEIERRADDERAALLELADRDAEAFEAVMAAFALPKGSDDEKAARSIAIQGAFAGAADVPMEVAQRAVELLGLAVETVSTGNPDAASDGASGAAMLHAAVLCATSNVDINAASLKDERAASALRTSVEDLRARADELLDRARTAFRERTS